MYKNIYTSYFVTISPDQAKFMSFQFAFSLGINKIELISGMFSLKHCLSLVVFRSLKNVLKTSEIVLWTPEGVIPNNVLQYYNYVA